MLASARNATNASALAAVLPPTLPGDGGLAFGTVRKRGSFSMAPHLEHHAKTYKKDLDEVNDFFRQYTRDIAALKDQLTTLRDGSGVAKGAGGGYGGRLVDHFEREARARNELDGLQTLAQRRHSIREGFPVGHALEHGVWKKEESGDSGGRRGRAGVGPERPLQRWEQGRRTTTVTSSTIGFIASEMILIMTGAILLALYPIVRLFVLPSPLEASRHFAEWMMCASLLSLVPPSPTIVCIGSHV